MFHSNFPVLYPTIIKFLHRPFCVIEIISQKRTSVTFNLAEFTPPLFLLVAKRLTAILFVTLIKHAFDTYCLFDVFEFLYEEELY